MLKLARRLVMLTGLSGCRPSGSLPDYVSTHESAAVAIPAAVQMELLYGDADHFITEFGFDRKPKLWNTEVFFGGRYTLTMQVEVKVSYSENRVSLVEEPRFHLIGADEIHVLPDGRTSTRYAGDEHWFSLSPFVNGRKCTRVGETLVGLASL